MKTLETSNLLEDRRRVRIAFHGRRDGEFLQLLDVLHQDLPLPGGAEVKVVVRRPLLEDRVERLVLVARHGGEEVVLKLPL